MPIVQVNIIANVGEVNRNEMRDKVATSTWIPFVWNLAEYWKRFKREQAAKYTPWDEVRATLLKRKVIGVTFFCIRLKAPHQLFKHKYISSISIGITIKSKSTVRLRQLWTPNIFLSDMCFKVNSWCRETKPQMTTVIILVVWGLFAHFELDVDSLLRNWPVRFKSKCSAFAEFQRKTFRCFTVYSCICCLYLNEKGFFFFLLLT